MSSESVDDDSFNEVFDEGEDSDIEEFGVANTNSSLLQQLEEVEEKSIPQPEITSTDIDKDIDSLLEKRGLIDTEKTSNKEETSEEEKKEEKEEEKEEEKSDEPKKEAKVEEIKEKEDKKPKEEETKKEEEEETKRSQVAPSEPEELEKNKPSAQVQSLRSKMRSQTVNKKDFVKINLETLSAIAVADIKRFSLSSTAIVDIEIAKAKGIHPVKNAPPNPMCLLAIRKATSKDHEKKIEIKKAHESTSVMPKNSSPVWNEKKEMLLDQVKGEGQRFLVVEVRDKSPKGEFLGYVELNLNNIADMVQREEWFTLEKRKKKDKVTGEILLRTHIRPERKVEETIAIRGESFPTIPSFVYNSFWNQHCVQHLSITKCGITSIPEGISALNSLSSLQLADNQITTVPKTVGRIFTLKYLDLSNNRISKLPTELGNLKNLQVFEIGGNKFSDDVVPPCAVDLDLWCDIIGKPENWDLLIEEELHKRECEAKEGNGAGNDLVMDEKEKEIQRLLGLMK